MRHEFEWRLQGIQMITVNESDSEPLPQGFGGTRTLVVTSTTPLQPQPRKLTSPPNALRWSNAMHLASLKTQTCIPCAVTR